MKNFLNAIVEFCKLSKEDRTSLTSRAFIVSGVIVNLKFLLSGVTIKSISFAVLSGSEYALALGAVGGFYALRNATRQKTNEEKKE